MILFQLFMLLVIFLVDVTIIEGSADFRVARHSTSQSKVCEKYQKISSACRNCNTTVHCQVDNNGNWTETFSGYCPSNRKCVNGDCVFAERCPLPDTFFSCLTPGLYPDPADCFKYHICIKDGTKLIHYEVDCEGYRSYAFDPHTSICSDYSPVKGECNNYYVPVCKFPYEEGVIPNTSIYYQCKYYVDSSNTINLDVLCPYQKRCDNGHLYDVVTAKCPPT